MKKRWKGIEIDIRHVRVFRGRDGDSKNERVTKRNWRRAEQG